MSGFLLDTSALLALRDNERGANRVSELLSDGSPCYGSFMTLMEVFYRVWKDEGEAAGREAYADCFALPMVWIHETPEILQRAAVIKATHPLSIADAWIAA
ncbi:MAG TPA: PIN domain-containing protein, partial [Nitrosomonas sp.]|nr:PIN domain-containing protein [Nitrosomonas sp.]